MKRSILYLIVFILCSCSNTSTIYSNKKQKPNFSDYAKVIVFDLEDAYSRTKKNKKFLNKGKLFSEMIANIIEAEEIFENIERNSSLSTNEKALLIKGKILKIQEGSRAIRSVVGFGKAAACFEAKVDFIDNQSQQVLATIDINERTSPLGGVFASLEDLDSLIEASAEITIDEILKVK